MLHENRKSDRDNLYMGISTQLGNSYGKNWRAASSQYIHNLLTIYTEHSVLHSEMFLNSRGTTWITVKSQIRSP